MAKQRQCNCVRDLYLAQSLFTSKHVRLFLGAFPGRHYSKLLAHNYPIIGDLWNILVCWPWVKKVAEQTKQTSTGKILDLDAGYAFHGSLQKVQKSAS